MKTGFFNKILDYHDLWSEHTEIILKKYDEELIIPLKNAGFYVDHLKISDLYSKAEEYSHLIIHPHLQCEKDSKFVDLIKRLTIPTLIVRSPAGSDIEDIKSVIGQRENILNLEYTTCTLDSLLDFLKRHKG